MDDDPNAGLGGLIWGVYEKIPPAVTPKRYKVFICDRCKRPQMTSGDVAWKCLNCDKTNRLNYKGYFYTTDSPQEAARVVGELAAVCDLVAKTGNGQPLADYFNKLK